MNSRPSDSAWETLDDIQSQLAQLGGEDRSIFGNSSGKLQRAGRLRRSNTADAAINGGGTNEQIGSGGFRSPRQISSSPRGGAAAQQQRREGSPSDDSEKKSPYASWCWWYAWCNTRC